MTTLRLNFEGLKAAPGDAVESSYFLSNILGPVPTPALFTNVNYISNIIIAHKKRRLLKKLLLNVVKDLTADF